MYEAEEIEYPGLAKASPDLPPGLVESGGSYQLSLGPGSHPLTGIAVDSTRFLLRFDSNSPGDARMLARVTKVHRFRHLADFQPILRLPPLLDSDDESLSFHERIRKLTGILRETATGGHGEWALADPPVYSVDPLPRPISEFHFSASVVPEASRARADRQEIPWFCYFDDQNIPMEPAEEALEKARTVPEDARKECERLFVERPILSRLSIYCQASKRLRPHLKALLPTMGYYWVNGPWRHTWTRYGIDPRSDPIYRTLQVLECRNVFSTSRSATADMSAKGRRGGHPPRKNKKAVNHDDMTNDEEPSANSAGEFVSPDAYLFDGNQLTGNYYLYQLCDLIYEPAVRILKDPTRWSSELDEREGWYQEGTLAALRSILKDRWTELLSQQQPKRPRQPETSLEELLAANVSGDATPSGLTGLDSIDSFSSSAFASVLGLEPLGEEEADEYFIYDE